MGDKKLIEQYLQWNQNSLQELLEKHLQKLYSACYRVCLNETDAQDIAQEVIIKIIKNLKKFQFQSDFSTWYFRIAYNESINFLKKKKIIFDIDDETYEIASDENIEKEIETRLSNEEITQQINSLPLIERNIILYFYYDNLKIKEISHILQLNENTVKTKLSRAKMKLKYKLESLWKK